MQDLDRRFLYKHDRRITRHSSDLGPLSNSEDTYALMVLQCGSGCTEGDVDQRLFHTALDLGIDIPQPPKATLDFITDNAATLELASEEPEEGQFLPSRTSHSTHPASDCCSELKHPTKTSSFTTGSIASNPSSTLSNRSSRRSSYEKIKKGFRRISLLRRRRTLDAPMPVLPLPPTSIYIMRPPAQKSPDPPSVPTATIPATNESLPVTPPSSRNPPSIPAEPPSTASPQLDLPASSPSEVEPTESILTALHRSLRNPQLKALRASQLEEQGRFIRYEALQHHLLRLSQVTSKREIFAQHTSQQQSLQQCHDEILSSLEHRHLSAEVDLHGKLQLEKKGCDTRLRHMQAYCYPTSAAKDMPERTVTARDHQYLEQQLYMRNRIDNLHAARINVLREKQAKQLERIASKQEAEMQSLAQSEAKEVADLDKRFVEEEGGLVQGFRERRERLVRRWALAEAIERRKLEDLGSGQLGPLPDVEWGVWGWT